MSGLIANHSVIRPPPSRYKATWCPYNGTLGLLSDKRLYKVASTRFFITPNGLISDTRPWPIIGALEYFWQLPIIPKIVRWGYRGDHKDSPLLGDSMTTILLFNRYQLVAEKLYNHSTAEPPMYFTRDTGFSHTSAIRVSSFHARGVFLCTTELVFLCFILHLRWVGCLSSSFG